MKTVSYTALRGNLARALDDVNEDREPIVITRRKGAPAVLLALDEYESLEETAYLLRSPANAKPTPQKVVAASTRLRELGSPEGRSSFEGVCWCPSNIASTHFPG